jgi:hypothetical protein
MTLDKNVALQTNDPALLSPEDKEHFDEERKEEEARLKKNKVR